MAKGSRNVVCLHTPYNQQHEMKVCMNDMSFFPLGAASSTCGHDDSLMLERHAAFVWDTRLQQRLAKNPPHFGHK